MKNTISLRCPGLSLVLFCCFTLSYTSIKAQDASSKVNHVMLKDTTGSKNRKIERFTFHSQITVVHQKHLAFPSRYLSLSGLQGGNSLDNHYEQATSLTATIFAGMRLWKGASAFINPEISGGKGVSAVNGIAGFTNGETYRVGNPSPTPFIARAYIRQDFRLSAADIDQDDDINQIAGSVPAEMISLQGGKYALLDLFDDNKVSHDPRSDFLNWAMMGMGAWDYPADTRGYTFAFSALYTGPKWSAVMAISSMPTEANGPQQDKHILKTQSFTLQLARKYTLGSLPGTIRLVGFRSKYNGRYYADLSRSILSGIDTPSVSNGTGYRAIKYGGGINIEQQISGSIAGMMRASWNDGHAVTWAFTPIDRSLTFGFKIRGNAWKRKDDVLGIAAIWNGLSAVHRNYLAAGGHDFLIGDDRLNYHLENIYEVFYSARVFEHLFISPDYQFVRNPAYNSDRGPVNVFALRMHLEY